MSTPPLFPRGWIRLTHENRYHILVRVSAIVQIQPTENGTLVQSANDDLFWRVTETIEEVANLIAATDGAAAE